MERGVAWQELGRSDAALALRARAAMLWLLLQAWPASGLRGLWTPDPRPFQPKGLLPILARRFTRSVPTMCPLAETRHRLFATGEPPHQPSERAAGAAGWLLAPFGWLSAPFQ